MKSNTLKGNSQPWKVALEDAVVTGSIAFVSGLAAFGYPPKPEAFYVAGLTGFLTGLIGWARARGIQHDRE